MSNISNIPGILTYKINGRFQNTSLTITEVAFITIAITEYKLFISGYGNRAFIEVFTPLLKYLKRKRFLLNKILLYEINIYFFFVNRLWSRQ